jgi:hypothetical protein
MSTGNALGLSAYLLRHGLINKPCQLASVCNPLQDFTLLGGGPAPFTVSLPSLSCAQVAARQTYELTSTAGLPPRRRRLYLLMRTLG